jgi:hypothetical protein
MINILIKSIWASHEVKLPTIKTKNPHTLKKTTVVRIKKVADYEVCLKVMKSTFRRDLVPELELKITLEKMKQMNPLLFQGIIRSLPSSHEALLRQVMS